MEISIIIFGYFRNILYEISPFQDYQKSDTLPSVEVFALSSSTLLLQQDILLCPSSSMQSILLRISQYKIQFKIGVIKNMPFFKMHIWVLN